MDHLFPHKPAITSEAEDPEMEQWGYEATSALEAASVAGTSYLARQKEAGEALFKARKKCKAGKWISWLARRNIERTKAFRAIKAYLRCCTVQHLDDAIGELAESGQEQEKLPEGESSEPGKQFCGRNCRVGIGPSNCKACAKLNQPGRPAPAPSRSAGVPAAATTAPQIATAPATLTAPAPPAAPIVPSVKLEEILGEAETYQKLSKSARILSKKIRKVERSAFYRKATGVRSEPMAESILGISIKLDRTSPKEPCPACGGAVCASEDSEPCKGCGAKGVLTAAEAERLQKKTGDS